MTDKGEPMETMLRLFVLLTMPPPTRNWREERGDVPGWVLITVMTAGLVAILYKIAGHQLGALPRAALHKVT
jgi:hypothetical protein